MLLFLLCASSDIHVHVYMHVHVHVLFASCPASSRNLGVHISKVRSITLDEWEPEVQMVRTTSYHKYMYM